MSEDIQVPASVLTLRDLAILCETLIKNGANPDNPVLVCSDPEGNSLNTLCNDITLAKLDLTNEWLPKVVDISTATDDDSIEDIMSLKDTHIVIGAFQEFSWDDGIFPTFSWEEPVPFEVI